MFLENEDFRKTSLMNVQEFESWWLLACKAAVNRFIGSFLSLQKFTLSEKQEMSNLSGGKSPSQACNSCPLSCD